LDTSLQRQQAIAGNIANAETPGYKRLDLDRTQMASFQRQLRAASAKGDFSAVGQNANGDAAPKLSIDPTARSQRQDGNNVEIDQELLAMSRNTLE
jgi:flagellar basal-body rod protein FlgB